MEGRIKVHKESKKDVMRELQFESSDNLLMYLRFVLCLRNNWSPYLPNIEDENREETGAVINFNEGKHVWFALINETYNEHGLTEDNFKDLESACEPFLEDSPGPNKKGVFKISQNVLSKTSLKDSRKDSDMNSKSKSKKSLNLNNNKDKNINLDMFIRLCLNEYCEKRILSIGKSLVNLITKFI